MTSAILRRNEYLEYSLNFNDTELATRTIMIDWLPNDIIDCHAHCLLREHLSTLDPLIERHMASTFAYFSLEESQANNRLFFENKSMQKLRFALPFMGINFVAANSYLLEHSPFTDRIALYAPPDAIDYCCTTMRHPRVSALKMYYKSVIPWTKTIRECFPPQVLSVAQSLDIPIILHLPTVITASLDDLLSLLREFPRLRVVIAHLGSSKQVITGLREAFEQIAVFDQVHMDTAMNPTSAVVEMALEAFGFDRIMFGSDEPLHMVRSTVYNHPTLGERLVTAYPYHWVNPDEHHQYKQFASNAVHSLWPSLVAIKDAVSQLPSRIQQSVKEKIFFQNAKSFFGF